VAQFVVLCMAIDVSEVHNDSMFKLKILVFFNNACSCVHGI